MALPLIRHSLKRKDLDQLLVAVLQDKLGSGEYYDRLKRELGESFAISQTALYASPLSAVLALVQASGLVAGDRVVLSVLAPGYWVQGLLASGIEVVWSDVASTVPLLDLAELVRQRRFEGVKAVVADTTLGYIPALELVQDLPVQVFVDFSQGLGGTLMQKPVSNWGDWILATLGSESLLAGPGGCVLGRRKRSSEPHLEPLVWDRLSEMVCALVLSQWSDVEALAEGKRENFRILFHRLSRRVSQPRQPGEAYPVLPFFPVLVESGAKEVVAFARKNSVEADWAFRDHQWWPAIEASDGFPHARKFVQHTLAFPLYSSFGSKELELLGKVLASLP